MEPDFIVDQAKSLTRILAANAKHLQEKRVVVQDVFLHSDFGKDQAEALEAAVGDSVALLGSSNNTCQSLVTRAEFSLKQHEFQRTALGDSVIIQKCPVDTTLSLLTTSPPFVLELVRVLESVVINNAAIATERKIDCNTLTMSKPVNVVRITRWFRSLMECHVKQQNAVKAMTISHAQAEARVKELAQEKENISSAYEMVQAKINVLEGSLHALQEKNREIINAAETADGVARSRIQMLTSELKDIRTVHYSCQKQLQERNAEIANLKFEAMKFLETTEKYLQVTSVQPSHQINVKIEEMEQIGLERDELRRELDELRTTHETFCGSQADEKDKLVLENARLQSDVEERDGAVLVLENKLIKLTTEVDRLTAALQASIAQVSDAEVQREIWKASLDDHVSSHSAALNEAQAQATQERASREEADRLLKNAAVKIEDLERMLRERDYEILKLREAAAKQAEAKSQRLPISPPPSTRKSTRSSLRKRAHSETGQGNPVSPATRNNPGYALNLAAHGSPMPPERAAALAQLPAVSYDLGSKDAVPEIFTRQSLSMILGGSVQGLVVRCTGSATPLAREHSINDYLCPNMDHNAWSPAGPGQHGYMQVGLGRDRKLFNGDGEHRHVFVGAGKFFLYCGWYHVLRVDPLTKEEWAALPDKVKMTYSETSLKKEKTRECTNKELWDKVRTADQVLTMYNKGELRAPLVRLQFLKFDTAFYQQLVEASGRYYTHRPRPSLPNPAKRRRLDSSAAKDEEKIEEDSPATRSTDGNTEDTNAPVSTSEASVPSSTPAASEGGGPSPAATTSQCDTASSSELPNTPSPSARTTSVSSCATLSPSGQHRYATRFAEGLKIRIPGGNSSRALNQAGNSEDREETEGQSSESCPSDDDMYMDTVE